MGGVHPAGRRPAHVGGTDLGGREAREPRARPRRSARWCDRAHGRSGAASARDPGRREAHEQDPRDRHRGQDGHGPAGDQHAEALGGAAAARLHLSGQPRVVPVLARRRADRDERLVADRRTIRPHARPRDQLRDRAPDRRDHPGRRRRREKGAQVVVRLPTQAPLHGPPRDARDRHRGDARARQAARGGVLGILRLSLLQDAWKATGEFARCGAATLAGVVLFDEWKVEVPPSGRRGVHPAARLGKGGHRGRDVRERRRGAAPRRSGSCGSARPRAASTSATRSPRATGLRATTATPRRSTGAPATARSRS